MRTNQGKLDIRMHNFCTLFDSGYLTRGLAMYESLKAWSPGFHLYVYAFDDLSLEILTRMNLPALTVIPLRDFETDRLLAVKPERSRGEYCWTCTSHVIRHALDVYGLPDVTYVDADLYFFADPALLLDEFEGSGGSILLTEHRYTPEYDRAKTAGIFCVQFITFKADERGLAALDWWRERCIEWCFAREEDGRFGDQKYLDDWSTRFQGVHVLEHPGWAAPWNIQCYRIEEQNGRLLADGTPLVFYHFHDYKFYKDGSHYLGSYLLRKKVVDLLYRPYVRALGHAKAAVQNCFPDFNGGSSTRVRKLTKPFWNLLYRLKGTYNEYKSL